MSVIFTALHTYCKFYRKNIVNGKKYKIATQKIEIIADDVVYYKKD